jgi:hypothetical protein
MSRPFNQALRDARKDQRFPVSFAADMYVGRARHSVTVSDLSRNGAMLSGDKIPPNGTRVVVMLGAAKLFGTVAWVHDVYCGLALLEPIEPLQLVRDMTRGQVRRGAANQDKPWPRPAG